MEGLEFHWTEGIVLGTERMKGQNGRGSPGAGGGEHVFEGAWPGGGAQDGGCVRVR